MSSNPTAFLTILPEIARLLIALCQLLVEYFNKDKTSDADLTSVADFHTRLRNMNWLIARLDSELKSSEIYSKASPGGDSPGDDHRANRGDQPA